MAMSDSFQADSEIRTSTVTRVRVDADSNSKPNTSPAATASVLHVVRLVSEASCEAASVGFSVPAIRFASFGIAPGIYHTSTTALPLASPMMNHWSIVPLNGTTA